MAIKEILVYNNGLGELLRDFVCDTEAELSDIPGLDKGVISGSTATCLENKKRYMLSVAGEWKEAPSLGGSGSGGSGSGGGDDTEIDGGTF